MQTSFQKRKQFAGRRRIGKRRKTIHPLLGGEGWGEGGRSSDFLLRALYGARIIGQRVRRAFLQLAENRIADALSVPPQTGVPEAKHLDATRNQKGKLVFLARPHLLSSLPGEETTIRSALKIPASPWTSPLCRLRFKSAVIAEGRGEGEPFH